MVCSPMVRRLLCSGPLFSAVLLSFDAHAGDALFRHVGTFDVTRNGNEVAEIVAATRGGRRLIYTDSATGTIGFVDITDPTDPSPEGTLPVGGEPTSVAIVDGWALVAVDTSPDFVSPSGTLVVVDTLSRQIAATIDVGGQPDSVAVSPDGLRVAVVIENQRDEDLDDGLLPQLPAGGLVIVDLGGDPSQWTLRSVDLTGLSDTAPTDPEPEFVDINRRNEAIVSLQENNWLVLVDLISGTVIDDWSAGTADLEHIDTIEEELGPEERGVIHLTDAATLRREPDGVAWVTNNVFVTANEGDYEDEDGVTGGSRGFTLFDRDGTVVFESGESFEHATVRVGHYAEGRSENKGSEPEAARTGRFGDRTLLFVGAERANAVGVYDVTSGTPDLLQVLPTGIGPEGVLAIGRRDLLVVASETSTDTVPSMITLYQAGCDAPGSALVSADDTDGNPIPWVALSGLAGDRRDADQLVAVSDAALGAGYLYDVDVGGEPAVITSRTEVTGLSFAPDLEGVAPAPEGGLWLASEGALDLRPNAIVRVDPHGVVLSEVFLPDSLVAEMTDHGLEGVAATGGSATTFVYTVFQGPWGDDPDGHVKLGRYDVAADDWEFVSYVLDGASASELTLAEDGTLLVVESDDQSGPTARIKRIYAVDPYSVTFRSHGQTLDVVSKSLVVDLLPELRANSLWTPDAVDGLGLAADGRWYVVTDNGGLDETLGETVFLRL